MVHPRFLFGGKDMRLDKYLKVSRLVKRRTVANEACDEKNDMRPGMVHPRFLFGEIFWGKAYETG